MMRGKYGARRGATTVELAIVCPLLFLLIIGLLVGGLGVFRFQEVASLARECSRWASVHGPQYQRETGQPAATAETIYNSVVVPKNVILDPSKLTYSVSWKTYNTYYHTVSVTINYQWFPEAFGGGSSLLLSSTSETQMSY
jgi:Flp pilus assembly protein TadG